MNITIIRHSIRNRGGDRLGLEYLNYLAGKGHHITYWTNAVSTHFYIHPGIQIRKINIPGLVGTILFALSSKFKADVILVDLVVMAYFISLRNDRRKILYLAQDHDISYHRFFAIKAFINFCYRQVLDTFKIRTVSVSDDLSGKLAPYKPFDLTIIPNGIDLNFFYRVPEPKIFAKKTKPSVILVFARKDYRKGLDIALKTLQRLSQIRPAQDWEVWALGTEPLTIAGMSIKNIGFLATDENLRAVLSAADIYLIPSRSEGLSLLLLQALACQCAIATTRASSIITHEVDGLVSPLEDSESLAQNTNRILSDPDLKARLQKNARILAEKYSLANGCERFEKTILGFETNDKK